jgi:uncharacterized GH25 family protein
MASRNAVLVGFLGMGVVTAAVVGWFLTSGGPEAPPPETAPVAESGPAPAPKAAPAAGPAAAAAAPLPVGDGSLRGRLVRGVAKKPLVGEVKVAGEGIAPVKDVSGSDGRFVLEGVPRGRVVVLRAEAPGVLPAEIPVRIPMAGIVDIGDLVMGGAVRLEVKVRDTGDRPVAGAQVTLHRSRVWGQNSMDWISAQFEGRDGSPAAFTATTDAEGRTAFEETPPGGWTVKAGAKGLAEEVASTTLVEGAVREPLRIVLGPAHALSGSVLTREGKPVAGATVRGYKPNTWWVTGAKDSSSTTGADGKYRLEGLPRGTIALAVEPSAGVRVTAGSVDIPDVTTWDIRLTAGATVKGKVVDDATGAPVPGVEVTVQTYPDNGMGPQGTARTTTAEDGTFLIAGLAPGNLAGLNVRAKGFLAYPGSEGMVMAPQTRVPEGDTVEREIRLRRGGVLKGRVLDRAGKPVPGTMVRLKMFNPRAGVEDSPPVKADAEGAFRMEGVPRGKGILRAEAPGFFQPDYPQQEWQALQQGNIPEACAAEVPAEGEGTKDLVLAPGGVVEGVVVDRDGKPAPGISVNLYAKGPKGGGGGTGGLSDAEGKFRAEGAAPGEEVVANASGPGGLRGASDPFRLGEGESTQGIRITLKAAATVAGRVRREDGGAAQGASLRIVPGKRDTNNMWNWNWQRQNAAVHPVGADGVFRVEGLNAGPWTVVCEADGAATSEGPLVELTEGETKEGVEVVLPEEKRISGKVLNPEGAPVAGAPVRGRPAAQQQQWYGGPDNDPADATTDAAGLFTVRGLGKGSWRVIVRAEGFAESVQTVEGPKDDIVFNLVAGMTIEGVVTDEAAGTPVAGISVWGNPNTNTGGINVGRSCVSGKDGTFALRDLTPGAWSLTFAGQWDDAKNDFAQKVMNSVEAGTKDLRVALSKGLAITGKVRDENGKAVGGFYVQAVGKDSNGNQDWTKQRSGQVQADGSFRLGGLPTGNYDLTFHASGGGSGTGVAPTTVKNVAAGTEDLVVNVKQGLPVSGKIVDEKGNPPGQPGNFQVQPSDDHSGTGATWGNYQADGVFTSQPLEPGKTYDIVVHPMGSTMGGTLKGVVAGQKDLVVVVKKGGTITGRILDEAGKAVGQGVQVHAFADGAPEKRNEPGGQAYGVSNASGEFTISGLGDHRFRITAGGGNSDFRPTTTTESFEVGATGVTLKVSVGVTIEGRLVDSKGTWSKTQVWIMATAEGGEGTMGSWVQPKDDGTFVLKGLAPGKVKIQAWVANKQSDLGTFDAPAVGLSITVPD